jgi:hypothetical protein
MSKNLRSLARSLARKLVQSVPRFAGIPEDEVNRLADYWAEDGFVTEDGVPCAITGTPLADSLRYALEQKAGATAAPNAPAAPATSASEDEERKRYGGFTEADFKALPFHQQHAVLEEVAGKSQAVESWRKNNAPVSVGEIVQRTGLSAEAFAALPAERRLEIENEVKFNRSK